MAKVSELWQEVEKILAEGNSGSYRFAVIEAKKVLKAVLDSKGFPGKDIKKQLFWAGYSLKEKEGLPEALKKHDEILENFDYQFSSFEAEETVKIFKKTIEEVSKKPKFSFQDHLKAILENHLSPKSLLFWRNLAIVFGFFLFVQILAKTEVGKKTTLSLVNFSDFVFSWTFLAVLVLLVFIILVVNSYLENKPKVKIKEEEA